MSTRVLTFTTLKSHSTVTISEPQVCLHPLVAIKHDASALLGALRQLSTAEALALLRYLRTLLTNYAQLVGDRFLVASGAGLPAAVVLPHPAAVLEWAGAAMDANMARLVLHREVSACGTMQPNELSS